MEPIRIISCAFGRIRRLCYPGVRYQATERFTALTHNNICRTGIALPSLGQLL